jgi:hypothetical protein
MTGEDDVRGTIAPVREARIYRAIHQAFGDYREDQARYSIWPRTRANMVFERLAVRLQEQFIDDSGVRFVFENETVKIVVDQKLLVRCKKADSSGLGHNVPTFSNDLFVVQNDLLATVAPFDKVEIVYVVNSLGTEVSKVFIQARDGDIKLWGYEIDDSALTEAAPVTPMPTPKLPPLAADASDLVQPRSKPAAQDEEDKI